MYSAAAVNALFGRWGDKAAEALEFIVEAGDEPHDDRIRDAADAVELRLKGDRFRGPVLDEHGPAQLGSNVPFVDRFRSQLVREDAVDPQVLAGVVVQANFEVLALEMVVDDA